MLNLHLQALTAERDEVLKSIQFFDKRIMTASQMPEFTRDHLTSLVLNARRAADLDHQISVELAIERMKTPFYKRIFRR